MLQKKISITVFFICLFSANTTLFAQETLNHSVNDTTYNKTHFLWFTGHWSKTKRNVFITTATTDSTEGGVIRMGGGSSVTVNPDGSVNINSQSIDNWNKKISEGEKELEKTKKEMTSPANEQKEWAYHFNKVALPILDTLKAQWTANKIDKKNDILDPENNHDKKNKFLQDLYDSVLSSCKAMEPKFKAIEAFYHKHVHDKDADFNNLVPPEMEFKCMACDTAEEKKYEKICQVYDENFFKPESGFIKDCLTMIRGLSFLGRINAFGRPPEGVGDDIKDKLDPLFEKGAPCAYVYYDTDLSEIAMWLIRRCMWRAEKLLYDNRKNYKAVVPVIRAYLEAAKQNCLMGNEVDITKNNDMYEIVHNAWEHYYFDLTEKHDWSQLANIPAIFGLERQYELLGGNDVQEAEHITTIMKILNSFELNIDMDVKAGKDGGYILSHLKGKAKIAPEFKYGADSCYEWVVIEDQPDALGQPIKKKDQRIVLDVLNNEIIIPKERPTYTGSKKYTTELKHLKMDYCHPGKDTILLTGFLPYPNVMDGNWRYPHAPKPVNSGINQQDHYFQDFSIMQQYAQSGAASQQADIIKEQSEKIAAQMKTLAKQMNGNHDASQMGNYQKMLDMSNKIKQLTNNEKVAPLIYIDFPIKSQNNSFILFKKSFDAKEINPEISSVLEHGYFTVDIEYKRK